MCEELISKLPIENTPIIKLKNEIYLKLEFMNLGGSIKSRVAKYMIKNAIKNGTLSCFKKETILEASGGNTAIGLIQIATRLGWNCVFVIPDNYSKDRVLELEAYGAKVYLSDHTTGNNSHILLAKKLKKNNPSWHYIDQINNHDNVNAHYFGTGDEILKQIEHIDYFISGIGSGGTITGIAKKIKNKNTHIVGVIPHGYSIKKRIFVPHNIQGIAIGEIPSILDLSLIDSYIEISNDDLINTAQYLIKDENLFLGISSIANISAALKLRKSVSLSKKIITIAPDSGHYYKDFYKNIIKEKKL